MKISIGKTGRILLFLLFGVGAYFALNWYISKPKTVGEGVALSGDMTLPDLPQPSLSGSSVKLPSPSKTPTNSGDKVIWYKMIWQAQNGTLLASGGPLTTKNSLFEKIGLNVEIIPQNDCIMSAKAFVDHVREYAEGKRNDICMTTYMASGIDNYINVMAEKLKDLGPEYAPVVFLTEGVSLGEDQVIGDKKYKENKNLLRGAILHGVKEDGDIDLGLRLAKDGNIKINPDASLYYYDALNLSYTSSSTQAAIDYNQNLKQKRKIVVNGKTTGKDTLIGIDLVATWTPDDAVAVHGRGGCTIISTGIYRSIMPAITISCKKFINSHREKMIDMTIAIAEAGDQIRSFKSAKEKVSEIAVDVWKRENKEFWLKYYDGIVYDKDTKLGGSQVFNLKDMANIFGLNGGRDIFKDIYNSFGKIHSELYPEDYKSLKEYSDIVDKSILRSALDKENDKPKSLALLGNETVVDYSKASSEVSSKDYNISFKTGSSEIQSFSSLDEIISNLSTTDGTAIEIYGHTDNIGNSNKNLELSEKRAQAVYDYFISKGLKAKRILTVKGKGDTEPISSNDNESGRSKNRRVQIKLKA